MVTIVHRAFAKGRAGTVETGYRAVADRLQFSNFADGYNPERQTAWAQLTLTAHARRAEQLLLIDLAADSTHYANVPAKFGAHRDLKRAVTATVTEMRDRAREYSAPIRVAFPTFVPDMLVADLTAQQPGDTAWNVARAEVIADMRTWGGGIEPVFLLESVGGRLLAAGVVTSKTSCATEVHRLIP